jgi:threonine/homoserine/homoserine lactone efflux protein
VSGFLPPWPLLAAFLAASFVLAVTPGPGVLYIVTRSAAQGPSAGLASVGGVAMGNLGNAAAASLGLAALFAVSTSAFLAVKCLGALYLVYLGVRALRARAFVPARGADPASAPTDLRRIFADGFVVALFNPKTTLFFAAFLPQFLPASAGAGRTLAMGAIFVLIAATTDSGYALASGLARRRLAGRRLGGSLGRYLCGGTYIGLGVLAALTGQRARP